MTARTMNQQAVEGVSVARQTAPGTVLGSVSSYTVPVGRTAVLRWVSVSNFVNAPVVGIFVQIGLNNINLSKGSVASLIACGIAMNAGDVVNIAVNTIAAASSFDTLISVDEYLAA